MPDERLIKHQRTELCFKNTEMRIRLKDVEVASRYADMEFNLIGKDGEETIEGVSLFTYLGRSLYQSDNDWQEVRRNIGKSLQVWRRLGGILRQERLDHLTYVAIYRAVVQAVLLFGLETWVLLMTINKQVTGGCMGFLLQVTGK